MNSRFFILMLIGMASVFSQAYPETVEQSGPVGLGGCYPYRSPKLTLGVIADQVRLSVNNCVGQMTISNESADAVFFYGLKDPILFRSQNGAVIAGANDSLFHDGLLEIPSGSGTNFFPFDTGSIPYFLKGAPAEIMAGYTSLLATGMPLVKGEIYDKKTNTRWDYICAGETFSPDGFILKLKVLGDDYQINGTYVDDLFS